MEHRSERLRTALDEVVGWYSHILLDCPPALGILTLNALVAAEGRCSSRCNASILPLKDWLD